MYKMISFIVHKWVWNVFNVSNCCSMELGCPLLRGSSDRRLRWRAATLPFFWKRHSKAQSPLQFSGRWRRGRSWWQKIYSPWFVIGVKCVVVSCCVRRLPAVEGAYVHWRRRFWGWFWRLRWLRAIIVIICIFSFVCDCHCRQDVECIGWQIQVVQARGNNWELPFKSIWHRWLVRVVINRKNIKFGWCDRGNWWYPCRVMLW